MPPEQSSSPLSSIEEIYKKNPVPIAIIAILLIGGVMYWLGSSSGYNEAQIDALMKEQAAKQVADDAVKSENPFQAENPLEGVETNPFEKVKKTLNPFEN